MKTAYIIIKDFLWEGVYFEPIDDGHPDLGSYSQIVNCLFEAGRTFERREDGKLYYESDKSYGVSMHEGSLRLDKMKEDTLSNLIKEGKIVPVAEENHKFLSEYEEWLRKYEAILENSYYQQEEVEYLDCVADAKEPGFAKKYAEALGKMVELQLKLDECKDNIAYLRNKLQKAT